MQQTLLRAPHACVHRPCQATGAKLNGNSSTQQRFLVRSASSAFSVRRAWTWKPYAKLLNRSMKVEASHGTTDAGYYSAVEDPAQVNMRNQVARRLEETARHFKTFGSLGFWMQLVCTIAAAGILTVSVMVGNFATAAVTTYLSIAGIVIGFISVFWSFGYTRLSGRLEGAVSDPSTAPQRTEVVSKLKSGLVINLLGLISTVSGLQATIGLLVAKAVNSPASSFFQGPYAGQSPVLALDVFLLQSCASALISHLFGLVFNLELLRSVTNKPPPQKVMFKPA